MIEIKKGIFLNSKEITFQASKSSGPGGQHVNKVNSRITLSYPLSGIIGLNDKQMIIVSERLASYIIDNEIRISSQKHRSQYSNKIDATSKLEALLKKALSPNKSRIKTKVPKAAIEKRLNQKNIRAGIKKSRKIKINKEDLE